MSSIIKAARLTFDRNFTLVGDEIDFPEIRTQINAVALLTMEDERTELPEAVADPREAILDLQQETDRILRETEEMVVEILDRARGEATVIMSNAQEDAQVIISEASGEAERIKVAALEQGHRDGLQKAFREMEEQGKKAREEAEQLIAAAQEERKAILQSAEPEIVKLVMAVAEKILAREVKTDISLILDIVREALKLAGEAENVRVMVNPEDADTVQYFAPQIIEPDQKLGDITVEGDNRIERGGCLVETEKGIVDARLQTRRSNIEDAFKEVIDHA